MSEIEKFIYENLTQEETVILFESLVSYMILIEESEYEKEKEIAIEKARQLALKLLPQYINAGLENKENDYFLEKRSKLQLSQSL